MKKAPESATFERQKGNFCNVKVQLSQPESSTFRIRKSQKGLPKENILQKERQNFIFRMSNYFIFFLYILTFPTPVYLCKTAVPPTLSSNSPTPTCSVRATFPRKKDEQQAKRGAQNVFFYKKNAAENIFR
ncbi:MAG: hypothetical protein II950_06280 [Prevotella sp.]|nr:hypothetical protein [Prevotella sp.]